MRSTSAAVKIGTARIYQAEILKALIGTNRPTCVRTLFMRLILLPLLTLATLSHAQQPSDLPGVWKAKMIVDQTEFAKQPKDFQKLIQSQVDRSRKNPWTLTLRKDGTYHLPLDHGQSEGGIWASKETRLHLRVKKESGKQVAVAKERVDKFDISADRKSFRRKLTPYITLEYARLK